MCSCICVHGILVLLQLGTYKWQVAEKKKLREGSVADGCADSYAVCGPAMVGNSNCVWRQTTCSCKWRRCEKARFGFLNVIILNHPESRHKMSQANLDHLRFSENIDYSLQLEACACE